MMNDTELMRRAIALSIESVKNGGGPFGAVIARNGEIVAEASNSVTLDNDPTAHAEVNCIRQATRKLGTFSLAIYYANNRKDAAAIDFDDDFIYREIALAPDHRHKPMHPLLRDEALLAFEMWQKSDAKTEY